MKKLIIGVVLGLYTLSFSSALTLPVIKESHSLAKIKTSKTYITGPKGGCYYMNKNNKKTYVDRKMCR